MTLLKKVGSLLLGCTLSITASADLSQCQSELQLSDAQMETLSWARERGREHDLGDTMMTLALKESSAGKYLMNARTDDYGVFMISLPTAHGLLKPKGDFERYSIIPQQLIEDRELNARLAVETLLFWKKHRSSYEDMIRSYNAGYRKSSSAGTVYWEGFRKLFHKLRKANCFVN